MHLQIRVDVRYALCCPNASVVSATAGMLSRLEKLICGPSPTLDDAQLGGRGGRAMMTAASEETRTDEETAAVGTDHRNGAAAAAVPCVGFRSVDGYKVFNFGENRMCGDGDVRLPVMCGRRYVPSPYGGKVFVTEMRGRHLSHLVDPFTGERTPLPDLPIPFCEEEPMLFDPDEPRVRCSTDDRFAWDWSPRGVMVARGDTVFFCESGGGAWAPVHRSRRNSSMTVNYRDGCFFVLELRSLRTTVIDARTLSRCAEIKAPPHADDIDKAFLVASTDDVLLLVRHAGDGEPSDILSHVYIAQHRHQRRRPRWSPVTDIGDRAVFVDGAHGFTVRAGGRVQRNCLHMILRIEAAEELEVPSRGGGGMVYVVGVAPVSNPRNVVAERGSQIRGAAAHWIIRKHRSSSM